jgi:hypothetical protein
MEMILRNAFFSINNFDPIFNLKLKNLGPCDLRIFAFVQEFVVSPEGLGIINISEIFVFYGIHP